MPPVFHELQVIEQEIRQLGHFAQAGFAAEPAGVHHRVDAATPARHQ